MINRLVLVLLCVMILGINAQPPTHGVRGTVTAAELQPASLRTNQCFVVTDAGGAASCAGGGAIRNICCSDGTNWVVVGDGAGAGSYTFLVDGDTGPVQTVTDAQTLLILGDGTGIDTVVSAPDTMTVSFDATEVNDITWGNGSEAAIDWTFNGSAGVDPVFHFGNGTVEVDTEQFRIENNVPGFAILELDDGTDTATVDFKMEADLISAANSDFRMFVRNGSTLIRIQDWISARNVLNFENYDLEIQTSAPFLAFDDEDLDTNGSDADITVTCDAADSCSMVLGVESGAEAETDMLGIISAAGVSDVRLGATSGAYVSISEAGVITYNGTAQNVGPLATVQTLSAGETIAANACGGFKRIGSGSSLSTDATDTFTTPASAGQGCIMEVCNVNVTFTITLVDNVNFDPATAGNVVLSPNECITVGNTGTIWLELNQAGGGGTTTTTVAQVLPAGEWIIPQSAGPQEEVFGTNFPRTVLAFDPNSDESIFIEEELPSDYRNADAFTVTIAWSTASTDTGNQGCWCIGIADYADGAASDPTAEETVCEDTAPTATGGQRIETSITLTQGNYAAGNGIVLELFRDTDSGDAGCEGADIAAEMRFHSATLIYEVTL